MDEIPDFARGFCAGRKSVLRTNLSGCACMWDDKDEEVIVSVCAAHKDMIEQRLSDYIHKSKVPVSCGGTMEEKYYSYMSGHSTVLKSGGAEIQCPIKGLCQTQNPIGLHRNIKSFEKIIQNHSDLPLSGRQHCLEIAGEALRWNKAQAEKSLRRRKRAPETVGGKDE